MKVFNLCCAGGHGFEGWFASEDAFAEQIDRGLVECPMCADRTIQRLPSAPRLNLSGARDAEPAPAVPPAEAQRLQAMWLQAVQHVLRNTEDVGQRFPEEARRIHYGETERRGIRGQASADERAELAEEGIEVVPLPVPAGFEGPAH
ncbi:MAG: DUF1178 family protein [Burkholderiales bacterium]|nr:DUF1178 family protein [Burkholderiales bacterium]